MLTLFGALEADVEFLHVVVHQSDFVVAHQHLHDVCLDSALGTGHLGGIVPFSRLVQVWCGLRMLLFRLVWPTRRCGVVKPVAGGGISEPRGLRASRQQSSMDQGKLLPSSKENLNGLCSVIELG